MHLVFWLLLVYNPQHVPNPSVLGTFYTEAECNTNAEYVVKQKPDIILGCEKFVRSSEGDETDDL